jgi:RNA polymerase sigma factor (sigma-70 family)
MSEHFKDFVAFCNKEAKRIAKADPRDQEKLLTDLFVLEDEFRRIIATKKWENIIYPAFVDYIVNTKGNVLAARVYFRERQSTFSAEMSKLFKNNQLYTVLGNYKINYEFINWVCKNFPYSKDKPKYKKLHEIKDEVVKIRQILSMKDVFLALNRARLFWNKSTNCKLDYMDIVQDACEGYLNAVDKFTPPYTTTFRAVAIGRMLLKMLTDNNAPMVRLPPTDQRVLYRINNAKYREGLSSNEEVLEFVKESFPNVSMDRLLAIEASTEIFYPFGGVGDDGKGKWNDDSEFGNPEERLIEADLKYRVSLVFSTLTPFQQKLIKLKFGDKKWS